MYATPMWRVTRLLTLVKKSTTCLPLRCNTSTMCSTTLKWGLALCKPSPPIPTQCMSRWKPLDIPGVNSWINITKIDHAPSRRCGNCTSSWQGLLRLWIATLITSALTICIQRLSCGPNASILIVLLNSQLRTLRLPTTNRWPVKCSSPTVCANPIEPQTLCCLTSLVTPWDQIRNFSFQPTSGFK